MKHFAFILIVFSLTGFIFVSTLDSNALPDIIEVKTKPVPLPQVDANGAPLTRYLWVRVTAYSPPNFPEGAVTASGDPVGWGDVAVDPNIIPFGSEIYFSGHFKNKRFRAKDTGEDIKGAWVDIWMKSEEEAIAWGSREILIVVKNANQSRSKSRKGGAWKNGFWLAFFI